MVGKIFRQSQGIGTDPGPQIANGYLFGLETMVNTNIQRETVRRLIEIQDGVSIFYDLKAFNSRLRQRSTDPYISRGVQKKTGQELTSLTWTCSSPEAWFMSECTTRGSPRFSGTTKQCGREADSRQLDRPIGSLRKNLL